MKRYALSVSVLLLLTSGCGNERPAPKNAAAPAPAQAELNRKAMEGRGVDLRLYDSAPTPDAPRKPRFWVHADEYSLDEKEEIWSLANTEAVIYGKDEASESITLKAGSGRFQQEKAAYLGDGVVAQMGGMTIELTDFEWINEERLGRSDHPVSIVTPDSNLTASSLRLYPDEKKIILTHVSGTMRFPAEKEEAHEEPAP